MSTYVIGDIHGCYLELEKLLDMVDFNPRLDKVIFVGDLVGRGPYPTKVLDLIIELGNSATSLLGNHDIKFLAMAYNIIPTNVKDNVDVILKSVNLEKYTSFLSSLKLIHIDSDLKIIVAHAGIPPIWDVRTAQKFASFFEQYTLKNGFKKVLEIIFKGQCLRWNNNMTEEEKMQYIIYGFTKMKFCYKDGSFDSTYQSSPGIQPSHLYPWFLLKNYHPYKVVFGHWAALGLYYDGNVLCCDTGCVWGDKLSAIKMYPDKQIYQINNKYNSNSCKKESGMYQNKTLSLLKGVHE